MNFLNGEPTLDWQQGTMETSNEEDSQWLTTGSITIAQGEITGRIEARRYQPGPISTALHNLGMKLLKRENQTESVSTLNLEFRYEKSSY